jgi:hypothetical protein
MEKKLSKWFVNYREATGSQYCGNCSMFTLLKGERGTCSLVKGDIYKFDVCDLWEAKE